MDLNEYAIGGLHFDDVSLAEEVYAHAPAVSVLDAVYVVNNAVAITGGTDTLTLRRGIIALAQTLALTAAAEAESSLVLSKLDANNRFAHGERISALSDGGGSSVNQADLTFLMKRMSQEHFRVNDFALVAYFDDTSAVEVAYLPIPCGCRIKRIQASNILSVTTAGVITIRRNNDTAFAATLPLNDQGGVQQLLEGDKLFAEATNFFRVGDRIEFSTAGGTTGSSEAYLTVTFERTETDLDLRHFFLTAQFDNVTAAEPAYIPVPFRSRLVRVLFLTHTTHTPATISVQKQNTVLGTIATAGTTETIATFEYASSETLETGDAVDVFQPGERLELIASGGATASEVTAVAIFRRLD